MPQDVIIYTDGGCRNNPGPASIGVVIQDKNGTRLDSFSRHIGEATNNQAEYRALIAGLEKALELHADNVEVMSDSQLMVEQMSGRYKVKDAELKPLFQKAQDLRWRFSGFSLSYIPREKNREADQLACQALNSVKPEKPGLDFTIRKAKMVDIGNMNRVWAEVEEQHAVALPKIFRRVENPTRDRRYVASIMSDNNSAIFIAEHEGETIGLIQIMMQEPPDVPYMVPRRFAKISDLVVAKKFQRNGVGNALMAEAEKWAKDKKAQSIELNVYEFNEAAQAFYQRQGYDTTSRMMSKELRRR